MIPGALAYGLVMALVLGAAHVAVRRKTAAFPLAAFVALGAAASTVTGLVLLSRVLLRQAAAAPLVGVAWTLGLAVGLAGAGGVIALAHVGVLRGATLWLARRQSARSPAGRA